VTLGASFVRDGLIENELLSSPRHGYMDFTVPRFAANLRAAHALEDEPAAGISGEGQ
jgi:hypothetical protein